MHYIPFSQAAKGIAWLVPKGIIWALPIGMLTIWAVPIGIACDVLSMDGPGEVWPVGRPTI